MGAAGPPTLAAPILAFIVQLAYNVSWGDHVARRRACWNGEMAYWCEGWGSGWRWWGSWLWRGSA